MGKQIFNNYRRKVNNIVKGNKKLSIILKILLTNVINKILLKKEIMKKILLLKVLLKKL